MKIAIPSTAPDLGGMVEQKLGTAAYLLVVETDDMSFEVMDGPSGAPGPGAGVQVLSMVVGMGAKAILVGYVSPGISRVLQKQGIAVSTKFSGSVAEAVTDYMKSLDSGEEDEEQADSSSERGEWSEAFVKGLHQFYALLPKLVGVILLLGLFRGFVSEQALLSVFSGSVLYDSVLGAGLGSILAGNPINSYVIGKSLLSADVGMTGAAALMLAWVNVGVIQLPVEVAAMGMRFALVRNIAGFFVAVVMAFVIALGTGGSL